jgi:hypothetical protein
LLYLLDANTLITAKNDYYGMDRVPEFWSWLVHQAGLENIKLPQEIYDELADKSTVKADRDELAVWVDHSEIRPVILLGEEPDMDHVSRVTYNGYTPNPTDADLIKMGADPILVSYALRDIGNRTVVTTEGSRPSRRGANRHVPDVCEVLGVRCINTFQLLKELDFRTNWEALL